MSALFIRPPSFGEMDQSINQRIPKDLDRFPLIDIILATNNFSEENIIEKNSEWIVYKGELSGKKLAFVLVESNNYTMINIRHVVMFSSLPEHQNIVSFIGCCDNYGDKVIFVLEHPTRGGLDKYVSGTHLTWLMRVRICLNIASGLHYLQNIRETHAMKIEDLNSASIHLDENWKAKIQLITPSALINYTRPRSMSINLRVPVTYYGGKFEYVDEGELGYSFGVILFELLCARLAVNDEEGVNKNIMSFTRPMSALFTRPPSSGDMDLSIDQRIPKDLDRFPLIDIILATNNFSEENIIEKNSEWIVYKGELSRKKLAFVLVESNNYTMINIRHVVMFSSLPEHQNIVSFIGCCDNYGDKVIFVLEHPTRGGLDKYVSGTHLTWLMRVRICLDIASGLHYLLNNRETHAMKIEDLNSASIHLDENWKAKIQLITPSALIYYTRPRSMIFNLRVPVTYYGDPLLRAQMNKDSIVIFSEIAYRCLNKDPSLRPTISVVIEQLQKVLKLQQGFEISELEQLGPWVGFIQNLTHIKHKSSILNGFRVLGFGFYLEKNDTRGYLDH
nr:protein kinase-like domain-containing protein [Tanacetum cinerariifolium]